MQQNEALTFNSHFPYFHLRHQVFHLEHLSLEATMLATYFDYKFHQNILTYNFRDPNIPDRDELESPL